MNTKKTLYIGFFVASWKPAASFWKLVYLHKPRNFIHMEGDTLRRPGYSDVTGYMDTRPRGDARSRPGYRVTRTGYNIDCNKSGYMDCNRTVYSRGFEVRCIVELDDDESFQHNQNKCKSPPRIECSAMKERLARHMKVCPSRSSRIPRKCSSRFETKCSTDCQTMQLNIKPSKKVTDKEILTDFYQKSLALSPIISMDDKLFCNPYNHASNSSSPPASEGSFKTIPKSAIKSVEELYSRKTSPSVKDRKDNKNDKKVKASETVIFHPRGQYKDNLQTVILQWLLEIPVFPHIDQAAKIIRDNAVNDLNEEIFKLSSDINNINYEENVRYYIQDFLKDLPIWYPTWSHRYGSSRDHKGYKKDLENNLFDRIKTLNTELSNASSDKKTYVRCIHKHTHRTDSTTEIDTKIEKHVLNYLSNLKYIEMDDWGRPINIHRVKHEVIRHLKPILKIMAQLGNNKLYLKSELINILRQIPLVWPHHKNKQLDKYAEELSNIILDARPNKPSKSSDQNSEANALDDHHSDDEDINKYELTQDIVQLISSITNTNYNCQKQELYDMLLDSIDSIQSGNEKYAEDEIYEFISNSYNLSEQNAIFLTKTIVNKMKCVTKGAIDKSCSPMFLPREKLSKDVLVFMSDHDLSGSGPSTFPTTSTPRPPIKKEASKLSAEEKKYLDDLSKLINAWIDTVPQLAHVKEDKNYKELMVSDLAGTLMDEMKLEQYGPDKNYLGTRDNLIKCTVLSWMIKFEEEAFQIMGEDQETSVKYLDIFYAKFTEIPVPVLTKPHHGTRQDQKASKFRRDEANRSVDFIPEGIDVLEDEISIWMNEQPSHIYVKQNNNERNEMLHSFALKVQDQLKNKKSGEEIKTETKHWLEKIIVPNEKKNIENLSEVLKERVMKVPLDETLKAKQERKIKSKHEIGSGNLNEQFQEHPNATLSKYDLNKTLIKFIDTFIDHNYEEDDILVKGALSELLKTEFRRLSPSQKSDLYQGCGPDCGSKQALPDRLNKELYYIKEISDWLNNLPIDQSVNTPGNQNRIEYVISLAKDICDVEIERIQAPEAMSYDNMLIHLIRDYLQYLPFLPNKGPTHHNMIELYEKIYKSRSILNKNEHPINTAGNQGWGEFIDEYMRVNGKEIADDPVKLEVWKARIMQEILKMLQSSEPITGFHTRIGNVPKPGDETVIEFNRKLMYAHEIGDWIKNMPLQAIADEETSEMLMKMISNLADELSSKHTRILEDDDELREFVMNWILTLPLEPSKEIDIAVLIQQLSNRIKRVNEGKNQSLDDTSIVEKNQSITKKKPHNVSKIDQKQSISKTKSHNSSGKIKVGCSGELLVDAIENWSKKLPIKEQDANNEKEIKDNIAIRLFQKVGDLNIDPRFDDDALYQELIGDEIDNIFTDLKKYDGIQKNKDNLKSNLLNAIGEARSVIKQQTAGEQYKQKLENTIEASIPAPVTHKKIYDPGFEIYKNKLTNMFILENFDHGDDPVRLKYEVKIKDEIDKYFQEAQKRNAIPISRDEIYNDLYSALFKVPIPNETSVIQEVEEVKLRCEIDEWFEHLPIREAINLNEQLEWDQILAMLAKRIYEIEHNGPHAEEKIHKEITKWIVQLPLLPGEEKNIEKHAKALEERLKSSKNDRKYIPRSQMDKVAKKGKSLKNTSKKRKASLGKSQAPGPSTAKQMLPSPPPCCVATSTPRKKPGDLILEIVENWCLSLPLSQVESGHDRIIRDNLATEIFKKLSELNIDPRVFDDDMLYDEYLNDELERLFRKIPMCCELQRSKDIRKQELISAIRSVKPLIRQERARHDYKKEIKNTIKDMLPEPLDTTVEKAALFKDLVDGIADSFVQYNYNRDDYEGKQEYKNQIREAVIKYFSEIQNLSNEDPLWNQNKLICELIKIPIPSEAALKEDVEEIKMKDEVSNFLDEVIPDDSKADETQKSIVKSNLSKRLHDLEKSGHSCANDKTMKEEIVKSLKKVNQDVDINKVEEFVSQLKENEQIRKSLPIRKPDVFPTSVNISAELQQHGYSGFDSMMDQSPKNLLSQRSPIQYESEKFVTLEECSVPSAVKRAFQGSQFNIHSPGSNLEPLRTQPGDLRSITYHSDQSSVRRIPGDPRSITYHSDQSSVRPPLGIAFDARFPPRPLTQCQSLDFPSLQNAQRQQSLQAPLNYDYDLHDRYASPNYRDICVEQPAETGHMPLPVLSFNDDPPSPQRPKTPPRQRPISPTQNRSTTTSPRPMSPAALSRPVSPGGQSRNYSMQYPPASPGQVFHPLRPPYPSQRSTSPSLIQPTSPANASSSAVTMNSQYSSYQLPARAETPLVSVFEESLTPVRPSSIPPTPVRPYSISPTPVVSPLPPLIQEQLRPPQQQIPQQVSLQVPVQQPSLTASQPMTTQSYQGFQNNVAAVSSPVQIAPQAPIFLPQPSAEAPTSQQPEEPREGTQRRATPRTLRNPPRKRRRIRANGEEEEICECLGRDVRCSPFPDFPFWCFMPYRFPSFCFY